MERRFWSFSRFVRLILPVVWASALAGCAGNPAAAPASVNVGSARDLIDRARELSARGESHRAEQYFLAALEAGGPPDDIYPELIEVCLRGGRLGRAAVHVETRMRQSPDDLRLVRLAIAIREALRHEREASDLVQQLVSAKNRSEQEDLFLAGYFERAQDFERASAYYLAYLQRTDVASRPAWVAGAVQRVQRLSRTEGAPTSSQVQKVGVR